MRNLWKSALSLVHKFAGWLAWSRRPVEVDIVTPSVVLPTPASPVVVHRKPRQKHTETSYYYLDDLLAEIPTCRKIMRKFKQIDEDAYNYHAKVGARLVANERKSNPQAEARFREILPATAMVYFPPLKNDPVALCVYFIKLTKKSAHIAVPVGARAVYRVSIVYVPKSRRAAGYSYTVAMMDDGPKVVTERSLARCSLPKGGAFTQITWGVSPGLEWHWKMPHNDDGWRFPTSHEFGAKLFSVASGYVETDQEFHVRAERDGMSVSFGVALKRTPYFFKNRDKIVNERGKTRPIFHAVEEHTRTLASGKTSFVPAHYRGLRRFTWNGELVTITRPEHSALEWNAAAEEVAEREHPKGMVLIGDVADTILRATERLEAHNT